MRLPQILSRYIKQHGNESIDPVHTLLLLIYNLAIGKAPLYELQSWSDTLDLQRIGIPLLGNLWTDDRFGRVLDGFSAGHQLEMDNLKAICEFRAARGLPLTPEWMR